MTLIEYEKKLENIFFEWIIDGAEVSVVTDNAKVTLSSENTR